MNPFYTWEVWAVAGSMQVPLKTYSATEDTAEEEMVEWSEGFPNSELHLRKSGRFVAAYFKGVMIQRGGTP